MLRLLARIGAHCLIIWLPLHLYHFRGAQLIYCVLVLLLLVAFTLEHFSASLTRFLAAVVLGEENGGGAVIDGHLMWFQSTTRGGCGYPCMLLLETFCAFSIMRVVLMFRAVRGAGGIAVVKPGGASSSHQILSAWPVTLSLSPPLSSPGLVFLSQLSEATDTKIFTALQRTIVWPQLVCVVMRVVPTFGAGIAITELPLLLRAAMTWWVQYRIRSTVAVNGNNKNNTQKKSEAEENDDDDAAEKRVKRNKKNNKKGAAGGFFGSLVSEKALTFTIPTLVIVHAYALAIGFTATMILQVLLEKKDWGPHNDAAHLAMLVALVVHLVGQLVCAVLSCWKPLRMLMLGKRVVSRSATVLARKPGSPPAVATVVVDVEGKTHTN